jgi:DNA-binding NtrC family response regulator/tetratricopeptide (TPR) repeat protein
MLVHRRYEPRELLGRGAQGAVVRVVDRESPGTALVAKVYQPGTFDAAGLAAEFALLARCRIRGLVRAHDFGFDEKTGAPFFVEDFAAGSSLDRALADAPPTVRERTFAGALAGVLETLGALHAAGFVHGDLKPAHVRIDPSGRTTLLDLGAAVVRGERASAFTEGYSAPEIRGGAAASTRADLWSLGATFAAAARASGLVLRPSVSALLERLQATHPSDRPASAWDALEALGRVVPPDALRGARPAPVGRSELLARLLQRTGVTWLVGAPGVGKTFVAEELAIEALRAGHAVRTFRFPERDPKLAPVLSYLRGTDAAWPFATAPDGDTWLVFDGVDQAPREVTKAIEGYRCRAGLVRVLAVARAAPTDAPAEVLGPLARADFDALCNDLRIADPDEAWSASGGVPAWVAATAGRVPLGKDAVLARLRALDPGATRALAAVALVGGVLRAPLRGLAPEAAVNALVQNGLLSRHAQDLVLAQPALAPDLAAALGSCALVDAVADVALTAGATQAELALLANAPYPATRRSELLDAWAAAARREALPIAETTALLERLTEPAARTPARLLRLERLTRDTADAEAQERVFAWLAAAVEAGADAELACTFERRRAERAARKGAHAQAREHAEAAIALAPNDVLRALATATRGTVALFAAEWERALNDYVDARAQLRGQTLLDEEEVARLDHNLGVVALYKEDLARAEQAFVRSLAQKRALGDLAGVRSVLLNLGITRTRAGEHAAAARDLDEAIRLARVLGQRGGLAWCLVARADLALRAGAHDDAAAHCAEAESLADAMTAPVRADLALVSAGLALAQGRGRAVLAALDRIDAALRAGDPLIDARAHVLAAQAHLATLPADRGAAARAAIAALRRARAANLAEVEAQATAVLRRARDRRTVQAMKAAPAQASELEPMILAAARAASGEPALGALLAEIARATGAERAFAVLAHGTYGVDLDGLPIADAERRVPASERRAGVQYTRDAEKRGGRGSHVVACTGADAAMLVLEHRFAPAHFDAFAEERLLAWAALVTLVARGMVTEGARAAEPEAPVVESLAASTAMPYAEPRRAFPGIIGLSVPLKRALARLDSAIDSDLPTLILGETGVGKELFARALHDLGERARGPFVAVNCAAIPDSLFEAELFGHARGSFTGADRERRGLIARAEGGTLFLDEIGELAPMRQATLLRALETRRYRPVGSDDERAFDVRIVSATNRDLVAEVERGAFRRDLLYRLCVLEIRVPPLRERREDVPLLLRHFLPGVQLEPAAMDAFCNYSWPGNVRELAHQAQRLLALRAPRIELAHLPRELRAATRGRAAVAEPAPEGARERAVPVDPADEVRLALEATGGNISRAAERLGLTRHGLKKRMLRLGLRSKSS